MKLIFATHNLNKLKEVQQLLSNKVNILGLSDIDCNIEIPETGITLKENALIKVGYVKHHFDFDCFADDTGLEVDVLNGEPGVYSARYAGEESNTERNIQKLLKNLKGKSNRNAQFKTIVALNIKGEQHIFEGTCKGEISETKQGVAGFGYDPIFIPEGFNKSFAEMTLEEKSAISHRGKAINKFIAFLEENII